MSDQPKMYLNKHVLQAFYKYWAEKGLDQMYVEIDASYLDEEFRTLWKSTISEEGMVVFNISMRACRNIDMDGDAFRADVRRDGAVFHLSLPYHAFKSISIPHDAYTMEILSFPDLDRMAWHAANLDFIDPYRDTRPTAEDYILRSGVGMGQELTDEQMGQFLLNSFIYPLDPTQQSPEETKSRLERDAHLHRGGVSFLSDTQFGVFKKPHTKLTVIKGGKE